MFSWFRRATEELSMEERSRKFRKRFEDRKSEVLLEIKRSSELITSYTERIEREKKEDEEKEEVIIRKIYRSHSNQSQNE